MNVVSWHPLFCLPVVLTTLGKCGPPWGGKTLEAGSFNAILRWKVFFPFVLCSLFFSFFLSFSYLCIHFLINFRGY